MNFGLKSFVLCACFYISSILAFAQGTTCAADGEAPAQAAAIACVTGDGVQVKAAGESQLPGVLPLTPEQMPANPPTVTYENGKLKIVAKNSTLSEILRVVGSKTGALIDVPEGANERVVSLLGPGPAREVIAALLNGSHFNYVMVGTEANPNSVSHVILTAKSEGKEGTPGATSTTTVAGARPYVQPRTALQRAVMQPYREQQQQQQAQEVSTPEFQPPPPVALEEPPAPAEPEPAAQANGVPAASIPAVSAPAVAIPASGGAGGGNTETAAVEPPPPPPNESGAPRIANASGDRTPQQVLQDLYETRRQMMQQLRQPPPQQ